MDVLVVATPLRVLVRSPSRLSGISALRSMLGNFASQNQTRFSGFHGCDRTYFAPENEGPRQASISALGLLGKCPKG